jgi:hypothetical protein
MIWVTTLSLKWNFFVVYEVTANGSFKSRETNDSVSVRAAARVIPIARRFDAFWSFACFCVSTERVQRSPERLCCKRAFWFVGRGARVYLWFRPSERMNMIMLACCYGQIMSWRASNRYELSRSIVTVEITTVVEIRIDLFKLACCS